MCFKDAALVCECCRKRVEVSAPGLISCLVRLNAAGYLCAERTIMLSIFRHVYHVDATACRHYVRLSGMHGDKYRGLKRLHASLHLRVVGLWIYSPPLITIKCVMPFYRRLLYI